MWWRKDRPRCLPLTCTGIARVACGPRHCRADRRLLRSRSTAIARADRRSQCQGRAGQRRRAADPRRQWHAGIAPRGRAAQQAAVRLRHRRRRRRAPTHQLRIRLSSTRLSVIVDVTTARPDVENYGLNATYELVDLNTGKVVVKDTTFSRVSVDMPGQQQRFARQRGLRDAENRAAQVIADSIRNRLASYFTAGT